MSASHPTPEDPTAPATPRRWNAPLTDRLAVIGRLHDAVVANPERLIEPLRNVPGRRDDAESLAAEVLPLVEACRFLTRSAGKLLKPRRYGTRGRPAWLLGVDTTLHRDPWGRVLIIAPGNYPLMLPGIQVIQALAAGNTVAVKPSPAPGSGPVISELRSMLIEAGLPGEAMALLGNTIEDARAAMRQADHVVMTGSFAAGRSVLSDLADQATPATMELSGCDAVIVMPGADLDRTVQAIRFGLELNGSRTRMAPRRVIGPPDVISEIAPRLKNALADSPRVDVPDAVRRQVQPLIDDALARGASLVVGTDQWLNEHPTSDASTHASATSFAVAPTVLRDVAVDAAITRADIFAPVLSLCPVSSMDQAVAAVNDCPYRLSAVVMGPARAARELADQLDVGCVVVNDMIAPTADPRIPFGGRERSGFGVTRGDLGLLGMTQPRVVVHRKRGLLPHLMPRAQHDLPKLKALMQLTHGKNWRTRFCALRSLASL